MRKNGRNVLAQFKQVGHRLLFSPEAKVKIKSSLPIVAVIVFVSISFIFAWFRDPVGGGLGWSDQAAYIDMTKDIVNGNPLYLHFSVGYSLLAVPLHAVGIDNPFRIISYVLLLGSALFCYVAVRRMLGVGYGLLFIALLFFWDFQVRTFNYSMELFAVPWNNQVFYFVVAYSFWAIVDAWQRRYRKGRTPLFAILVGLSVVTRPESVLFVLPLLVAYLVKIRPARKTIFISASLCLLMLAPQAIANNFEDRNLKPDRTVDSALSEYFHLALLKRNTWEVLIDSRHYGNPSPPQYATNVHEDNYQLGGPDPRRESVLRTSWWLWMAPFGIILLLASRRVSWGVKIFMLSVITMLLFYLSGANMSGHKLQFHCIRYIAPAFIGLNFSVVYVLYWLAKRANTLRLRRAPHHAAKP